MPGMSKGTPAVTTSRSPGRGQPALEDAGAAPRRASRRSRWSARCSAGMTPQTSESCRKVSGSGVQAKIGTVGPVGGHLARGEPAAGEADDHRRARASPRRRRPPRRWRPRCAPGRSAPVGGSAAHALARPPAQRRVDGDAAALPLRLHLAGDPVHRPHRLERVVAHRRLRREHDRVGAVEDRVGDVGRLGAGGPRRVDHRLEHLGGGDHRLAVQVGLADDLLLHQRHFLERQLDARGRRGRP